MSLTDTEWDLVTEWARDHLLLTTEPGPRLRQWFDAEFVGRLPLGPRAGENAVALVEAVRNEGVGLQLVLLQALSGQDSLTSLPAGSMVQRFERELAEAARLDRSPEDHFLTTVLKNGAEVFLDRADLRRSIREFIEDPDKTVLVVDGEPDSGRSYTYSFIRHLGAHCGFRPVRVTLERTSTAQEVVQRLAEYVADPHPAGSRISPLNPTQLNDPLPSLGNAVHRIVSQATAATEQFWLVLDECDKLDATSDVWDCIGKLALAVYEHTPVRRRSAPRLVLLGYSPTVRQLPYEVGKNEVRDTARIAGPEDLQKFFREFFAATPPPGGQAPAGPEQVEALVGAVLPAVLEASRGPGPDCYMRKVCTAAEETVRLYRSLGPGADFTARLGERLRRTAAAPGPPPVPDLRAAYRAAACLLTRFTPATLRLPGEAEPTGRADLELVGDCRTVGTRATVDWVLKPAVRDTALRSLAGPEQARLALRANLDHVPPGPGPERTALAYLSGTPPDLAQQGAEELAHTLQAVLWLDRIPGITGIPDPAEVQRTLERARLAQPLERLVRDAFQGRTAELAELRAYLGLPEHRPTWHGRRLPLPEQPQAPAAGPAPGAGLVPPVLVQGPGGIGKSTLLAKLLLDAVRDVPGGFPHAYVDFERPTLSVHEPATLIAEMARQLGVQYPAHRSEFDVLAHACEEAAGTHRAEQGTVEELYALSTTRGTVARRTSSGVHQLAAAREADLARRLGALVLRVAPGPAGGEPPPLVVVIDSFEEAQYTGSPALGRMWAVWAAFQDTHPRMRSIVSGRLVDHPGRPVQPRVIALGGLDRAASVALLTSCGVRDAQLAGTLADRIGGHPLSLKLAARAVVEEQDRTGAPSRLVEDLAAEQHLLHSVDRMLVQGFLYERILRHIPDQDVRALAQAGLALRTVTPELVREVLAGACGLVVPDAEEAERLFGGLARLDLMEPAGPGAVRHRADLRSLTLRLADRDRTDLMRAVGQRAVAYYEAREGPQARAEEIYHRLRLGENPRAVERRWLPGVERFLAGADQDMAGRSAAYLSGHLGGHAPAEVLAEADLEDWEKITAREVEDLLAQEYPQTAAERLAARRPWTTGSPLHPLWVETLSRLGRRGDARAAADEAAYHAAEAGFPDLQLELLLQSARLAEEDGDRAAAERSLTVAEQVASGLGRDFEAMGALLARSRLGGTAGRRDPEVSGRLAERLRRLPDEQLARQPALVGGGRAGGAPEGPR
ncbi:AAA family ATPase, partial [Streptomyces antimicrobicus]